MMSTERASSLSQRAWRPSRRLWLALATIALLVAAAFRIVALDDVPPGLAQDEVLDADIALFIRGGEHALFFRHGYGHEPLYHYLAAPFGALYGDNVLAIRLPSVYLGLILVALTMRWAKRDYGATAALVAGLGLVVSWWPVIFSRLGIRPILEPVLLVAAIWFWPLRAPTFGRQGLASAALAGFLFGLSLYSYTAARVVPAIPALLLFYFVLRYIRARWDGGSRSIRTRDTGYLRGQAVYAAIILAVAGLVYLPMGLTLRANPELQQRLEQLEGPLTALRAGDPQPVLAMSIATLGVFSFGGDPRWTYSLPDRPLFDPLTSILFYAGLLIALWCWRQPVYALLPIWLVVTLLPSAFSPDAPSTVRLVGALPVVYLLPGLAVEALLGHTRASRPNARPRLAVLAGILLLVLGLNVYGTWQDGFRRWPSESETRLRYQTLLLEISRHWRETGGEGAPVVVETFFEPIDGASLRRNFGAELEARWVQTGGGAPGALIWPGGVASPRLYVPEYAPLAPELVAAAGVADEPIDRSPGSPSFAVYVLTKEPAPMLEPFNVSFAGADGETILSLRGAVMIDGAAHESAPPQLQLLTWWSVESRPPDDLAIFMHLVDESGAIVSQGDGLDAAAATLQVGDRLLQRHLLSVPALAPGRYELRLGLYRRGDGRRLTLPDGSDSLSLFLCTANEALGPVCKLPESS